MGFSSGSVSGVVVLDPVRTPEGMNAGSAHLIDVVGLGG